MDKEIYEELIELKAYWVKQVKEYEKKLDDSRKELRKVNRLIQVMQTKILKEE